MELNELKLYLEQYRKNFDNPVILKNSQSESISNASNTDNRRAWKGVSWIDYWCALTQNDGNILYCARCGKRIFVDINSDKCKEYVQQMNEEFFPNQRITADSLQAIGGHIQIKTDNEDEYFNGYYIVPLCKEHNNPHCAVQTIRAGTLMCAEIGATVE